MKRSNHIKEKIAVPLEQGMDDDDDGDDNNMTKLWEAGHRRQGS
jgi:hypothetical protein